MCGRFTLRVRPEDVAQEFGVEVPAFEPRFNIAPTEKLLVVRNVGGRRAVTVARWGLIPAWSHEPKGVPNARAETVAGKPSFREPFRQAG